MSVRILVLCGSTAYTRIRDTPHVQIHAYAAYTTAEIVRCAREHASSAAYTTALIGEGVGEARRCKGEGIRRSVGARQEREREYAQTHVSTQYILV